MSAAVQIIEQHLLSNTLDVTSRFIFRVAEFLDRLHPLVDSSARNIIYNHLERLHTSCAQASLTQNDTPEAYCSRFLALVLKRLSGLAQENASGHSVQDQQDQLVSNNASSNGLLAESEAFTVSLIAPISSQYRKC